MITAPFAPSEMPTGPAKSTWSRVSALHVVIITLSLAMTIGAWQFSKYQIDTRTQARFDVARDRTIGLIKNGMQKYEDTLWAGASTMNSHNDAMTRAQWHNFAGTLRIDERYPGINGIGVIHFLTAETLPAYLQAQRGERPGFAIFPAHDQSIHMPITYIEPEETNAAAVGLDVAHELNRRTAALASRDTGTAQITGPITLVQDAGNTPGFLFYVPFYANKDHNHSAHRPQDVLGAIYAPFVVRNLMAGLLAKELRSLRFSITDAGAAIYDEHGAQDQLNDPNPMYSDRVVLNLYGREWVLDLRTNLAFRAQNTFAQPTVVLFGGLIIELLIIAMLVMMSRANAHTIAYADRVTATLREEKHRLALTNEELEQFAYIASHDLKTPIRGISGLTEMIREDLEEYLETPEADPEIAQNLDRIDARVTRMIELTRGIMEFSRVGDFEFAPEPLSLPEAVETLVSDFALRPGQIELHSEVEAIHVDAFNLRRVLENLIGNAIKHHDGVRPLKIIISVIQTEGILRLAVTDNGPGIDPQFHNRVFEVFQTLREAEAPESTGIGLAIVKKLVERLGGTITLDSDPGMGATFSFDWPAQNDGHGLPLLEKAA